ncbi:hypothetical protein ACJMK2_001048 [Sinanodonta woodiana]|uniref:Uncharacterized protein n=1 Tax=Sinanodonta woodiana TaxID=1069815 RepID=A0ABD3XR19_SINWO
MRAVISLLTVPFMNDFLTQIRSNSELASMFESIQKDASVSSSDTTGMDTS